MYDQNLIQKKSADAEKSNSSPVHLVVRFDWSCYLFISTCICLPGALYPRLESVRRFSWKRQSGTKQLAGEEANRIRRTQSYVPSFVHRYGCVIALTLRSFVLANSKHSVLIPGRCGINPGNQNLVAGMTSSTIRQYLSSPRPGAARCRSTPSLTQLSRRSLEMCRSICQIL